MKSRFVPVGRGQPRQEIASLFMMGQQVKNHLREAGEILTNF